MAGGRFWQFTSGALFGAGIGTAVAVLFAPQSGEELQRKVKDVWHAAQRAGAEAEARTEMALIERYRELTGHADALESLESEVKEEHAAAVNRVTTDQAASSQAPMSATLTIPTSADATAV
jgi:gas vesicle protein